MWGLVGKPEDRFSHKEAHIWHCIIDLAHFSLEGNCFGLNLDSLLITESDIYISNLSNDSL